MWITRDFLFVDLRKELNSLTSRFRQVSCPICITTIQDETKLRIICLAKTKVILATVLLSNSQFLTTRLQAKQSIKPWPNWTKPREICYKDPYSWVVAPIFYVNVMMKLTSIKYYHAFLQHFRYMAGVIQEGDLECALKWLPFADLFSLENIKNSCISLIAWNIEIAASHQWWLLLTIEQLASILESHILIVKDEFTLFKMIEKRLLAEGRDEIVKEVFIIISFLYTWKSNNVLEISQFFRSKVQIVFSSF